MTNGRSPVVIGIFGPTASGKTAVAEAVADLIPADLISADALQLYRGLAVLTNQPTRPTGLVAVWPLDHDASLAEYQALAHAAIDATLAAGRVPVVVGGTGLYFRAALGELQVPPAPGPGVRARFKRLYDRLGPDRTHAALAARDPVAAATVHPNDRRRVVRALELHEAGVSLLPQRSRLWSAETRRPTRLFGLDVPRAALLARIEARTREMMARGAADEAGRALTGCISRTAAQAIGLRELTELPPDEALEAIVTRTRAYAAYQRKWMRRIPGLQLLDGERDPSQIAADLVANAGFAAAR